MKFRQFKRKVRLGCLIEENEPAEEFYHATPHILQLETIQPGRYVNWDERDDTDHQGVQNIWELLRPPISLTGDEDPKESDDQKEREEREGFNIGTKNKYDDAMLNVMWKQLQTEKQVTALLSYKLEQDRIAWNKSKYKLTSLEGKGEAELIRLLFVHAGEPFEDERITSEEWEELKPNTPYKSLPVLSKCGKQWGDTGAIVRVLARRFLLMGVTNDENLVVEATFERLRRLKRQNERAITWVITGEKNKERQEWAQSQLLHVVLPPAMKEWEQLITKTRGPFVIASGMTMADLAIMDFLDQCSSGMMIDSLYSDHLAVADLVSVVRLSPKIASYLDERADD